MCDIFTHGYFQLSVYVEARVDLRHTVDFPARKQSSTAHTVKDFRLRRGLKRLDLCSNELF
jgi:hypothetical protein